MFYTLDHEPALLALCAGSSPVTGEFPAQRPVTRSFDIFFDLRLNKSWINNREAGEGYMPLYSYGAPLRFYARAGAAAIVHCPGPITGHRGSLGNRVSAVFYCRFLVLGWVVVAGSEQVPRWQPHTGRYVPTCWLKNMIKSLNISLYSYEHT